MVRFSHPLLGTASASPHGLQIRSACGIKYVTASLAQVKEVAERLEPWRAPGFELRVRVGLGNYSPPQGRVTPIDETNALVQGVSRRIDEPSSSRREHGFDWHVCRGVLALRDGVFLRVLSPDVASLRPWLEECAALRLQCKLPVLRAAGEAPPAPAGDWIELRDDYVDAVAKAIVSDGAIHLDLPLEGGERYRQSVVGFLCAAEDPAARTLALSPRAREAAARWLFRLHDPGDAARLASWVRENGGTQELARTAADSEASFGGLRSVDRIQRFGGIQMLERALAPRSVAEWPLQESPAGTAVLVSQRDIDHSDALACVAEDGAMWRYDFDWSEWTRTSDSVPAFVARVALWGHPDEGPIQITQSAIGRVLAKTLGLDEIEEASDATGTFYAGEAALVFERRLGEHAVTRMRELRPEAVQAWDGLAPD